MNNSETPIEILFQKAESFGKTTIELFKLKAIDKSAEVVSSLALSMIISIVVSMIVLCLNVGMALWIGDKIGKLYLGFFIVAGLYLLMVFIIYIFRYKWIKKPVSNIFIKQMLQT